MNRFAFPLILVLVFFASEYRLVGQENDRLSQPNVVIVITDDQGYGDLSCHGNPLLKTPQLDRLAEQSVRLTDYHVSPTCSPTRGALMTGHWSNRTGVWHTILGRSLLRENEVTIASLFKEAGYSTGMFGKWHLGDNYPFRPEDRGFSEVMRHGGGGVGQTPDYWDNAYFDGSYFHNGKAVSVEGFCTDVFFSYAKEFIREQKEAKKPFLAYIATNAPHGPMHSPVEFSRPYQDQPVSVANFLGMISNIDQNVGKLRKFLADEGLADNTIFIFTTDNGTAAGEKIFNADMRGKKGSEYDGGHRVPFFIHWPKGDLVGGRDVDPLTAHVDVVPTLLELCNVPSPTDLKFDGQSIVPLLADSDPDWPDRILVTDSQRVKDPIKWRKSSVMTSRWRLINGKELYDMSRDKSQARDVASEFPEVVARLKGHYESWWAEIEPSFKDDARIYLGHPNENPANLNSMDWITSGSTPWNQGMIRKAVNGDRMTGFWNVQVDSSGEYEFELRRWPEETGKGICESIPPGQDVPGVKAMRTVEGKAISPVKASIKIGNFAKEVEVSADSKFVRFSIPLQAGPAQLEASFVTEEGEVFGAYFVKVTRLTKAP